ncbi:MAG: pyridoxal phosphate-dependent aminotransferase [Ignavibacteriales bacterium]|nr:pyridoxal phosphate-dependent aminotransferase [Ignavibacteriales bacterium]
MKIAKRISRLGTETAFEVLAEVNDLRSKGKDIIALSIGEPACATAEYIKDAAKKALNKNLTHYNPSAGIPEFRKVIAEYVASTRGIPVEPDEVVVVPGGKPVIFYSILACIEEGDEVIYPLPGYPIYESMINFAGGTPVPLRLREDRKFSFDIRDLRSKISDRTRMVIVNSPHNPTGGIIPKHDLHEIAELALKHDFWVLSDEIYSRIIYEGKAESISQFPGMKERTIILDGHSKTYAMTGWRVGYGVMPKQLAQHVARLVTNSVSCTATFTQYAAMEAVLGSQESVAEMVEVFKKNRDLIVAGLNGIDGFFCHTPAGAFYAYPNVTRACRRLGFKNSKDLQKFLLYKAGVAVLGQQCFGTRTKDEDQEYIRLSYVSSQQDITGALRRIESTLADTRLVEEFLDERHVKETEFK